MTKYTVRKTIDASPERLWKLLTDAGSYPRWNPAVLAIDGNIAEGERIKLTSIVNPDREFKMNVSAVEPPHSMVWSEGMPLGLFKGVRTYRLTPKDDRSTEFFMEEEFTGLMAPLITKSIPDMSESFEMFAEGLKAAAESDES